MTSVKHWIAATIFGAVVAVAAIVAVGVVGFIAYFLVKEFLSFVLTIAGCAIFIWATHWSESYIREHGWPWKSKREPE